MIATFLLSIIIGQFTPIVICKTIELICPTFQLAPTSINQPSSLDSSCFRLNINVNVENLLPDPTYILPEDNINAIGDGIKNTFSDSNVIIESNETDNKWTICNQCDESNEAHATPHNMQFVKTQYNISCNDKLHINKSTGTITCEFTLPESIVYVWHLQQINLYMDIKSESSSSSSSSSDENDLSMYTFHAKLIYNSINRENVIAVSQPVIPQENGITQFVFNPSTNTLQQNTTYSVIFESINSSGHIPFENVYCDPNHHQIITISEPSSCALGMNIAVTKEMAFGLESLCNESLAQPEQELFETFLFQKHTGQNHISYDYYYSLPNRRRLPADDGGTPVESDSLDIIFSDGSMQQLAPHSVFPSIGQCICVDEITRRVFSVGGNDENGNAVDRLAIYQVKTQTNATLLDDINFKLDKPRAMTTCYYYKRNDDEEYIIAINGMNHTQYKHNQECWYNDIVFIPLNNEYKVCNFPIVKLKFNVIDMKLFITQNDILYLIGGRNGKNATHIIQVIDLDHVFDVSDSSSSSSSSSSSDDRENSKKSDKTRLITHERMMPMNLHRVLPMTDFPFIVNQTCMITWGGQYYLNEKWVSFDESMTEIRMYCNKLLVGYLNTTRKTFYGTSENIQFSEYDNQNLNSNHDMIEYDTDTMASEDGVSILQYDFENDGLWYKFSVEFKICFDDKDEAQNKIRFFSDFTDDNQQILEENILIESQKNYRDWSYGFGKVHITEIDIEPIPCSKDSEEIKHYKNKKSKKRNKYKAVSANMVDKIDEYNYQMDEHYDNNIWKNIVAFGLCIIFLLWLSITCCCNKYKLYNKLTTK